MFCTSYILVFSAISYILVFSAYILVFLFFIVILYPRLLGNIQYPNRTPTCKHCIGPSANNPTRKYNIHISRMLNMFIK